MLCCHNNLGLTLHLLLLYQYRVGKLFKGWLHALEIFDMYQCLGFGYMKNILKIPNSDPMIDLFD